MRALEILHKYLVKKYIYLSFQRKVLSSGVELHWPFGETSIGLHSLTSPKIVPFMITAVRTSNLI
jgi:hypothetical protein